MTNHNSKILPWVRPGLCTPSGQVLKYSLCLIRWSLAAGFMGAPVLKNRFYDFSPKDIGKDWSEKNWQMFFSA